LPGKSSKEKVMLKFHGFGINLAAIAGIATLAAFGCATAEAQSAPPTAREVAKAIQDHVGIPWMTQTVDTFKAGDPNTPVTGIAVTMMATLDVLQRAAANHQNLIITHEPTFFSHQDTPEGMDQSDAVWTEKRAFIEQHHLVVWRFHDHWHRMHPDGILAGMVHALGWEKYQHGDDPKVFTIPETTLAKLASDTAKRLDAPTMRVVGNPDMKVTKIAMTPGFAGFVRETHALEQDNVEVLLTGETREWETVEYAADAVTEGKRKALIVIGHIPSEQAGMEECTRWLKTFISNVPIEFVPAKQPFWLPQ
jgi:putative NIF3 family GTP cyclohydrolase 1 type 2